MKIKEILSSDRCMGIYSEVSIFVDECMNGYNTEISSLVETPNSGKEIFDAVWGSVEFSAGEMIILDCPLLQRLRKIKQLGLASYVYCGADYSRFSHTIGVAYLATKMAKIVSKSPNCPKNNKQNFNPIQIVRLAAIFHDIGHMFFSHVSETYFTNDESCPQYERIKRLIVCFKTEVSQYANLHEIITVMMINSPSVKKLLVEVSSELNDLKITEKNVDKIMEYLSCLVLGVACDSYILPYSTIINGPIDADKCDYLSRDSHVTRVPVAVDIFRLIQKLKVVPTEYINKPKIWNDVSNIGYCKLALQHSALKAFVQLIMARSIMYESLYYHQKVLTAETMLRTVIRSFDVSTAGSLSNFSDLLELTDDAFNNNVSQNLKLTDIEKESENVKFGSYLLKCVNNRILYKRVACIKPDCLKGSEIHKITFNDILETNSTIKQNDFISKVIIEYNSLCSLLKVEAKPNSVEFMFVVFPSEKIDITKIDIPIDFGRTVRMASTVFQSETWMSSKEIRKKEHFFVTNQNDRALAFIAFESVLYREYYLLLNEDASICAKYTETEMSEYKSKLFEMDYYRSSYKLISDDMIISMIDESLIEKIATKYSSFEGIDQRKVDQISILNFLRQFLRYETAKESLPIILNEILELIYQATYVNRQLFVSQMKPIIMRIGNHIKADEHICICRSGSIVDGSSYLTYYFHDIELDKKIYSFADSISEGLQKINYTDSLLIIEDGAYSGKQITSIFQELMGVPAESREIDENHINPLSLELREKLKKIHIYLVFVCLNFEKITFIKSKLDELGVMNIDIEYSLDLNRKCFDFASETDNYDELTVTRNCLYEIGYELLKSAKTLPDGAFKEKWSEDRVLSSSLGYNDSRQMVFFRCSTPTYTITPFWADGKYKDENWIALFPRTPK